MNNPLRISIILTSLWILCCTSPPTKGTTSNTESSTPSSNITTQKKDTQPTPITGSFTDPRDGETYTTIKIGIQTWMAQNLRYDCPGSMLNSENPSKDYGRLYGLNAAQNACPEGWHIPSDTEWDQLEIEHGMPMSFIGKGGWRGEHATHLKSTVGWTEGGNGTDSLGFNVLPAGYYFSEIISADLAGMQGVGSSAAFWSAIVDGSGWARFMFDVRTFVNKWEDDDSGTALSSRCVMN